MMDDRPHRLILGFYTSDQSYTHTRDRKSSRASIDDEAFRGRRDVRAFFLFFF